MKRLTVLIVFLTVFAAYSGIHAQADTTKQTVQHGKNFVDKNGDGYNDNAPDHDGDGIPNGLDPDYTGPKLQKGKRAFVDLNGDGIDDNTGKAWGKRGKGGYGLNKGVGPKDGTGNGSNAQGGNNSKGSNGRSKKWGTK